MRQSKKEINKRYRENNKEKIALQGQKYYQKNKKLIKEKSENLKEEIAKKQKIYYEKNKDKIKARAAEYRLKNSNKIKQYKEAHKEERNKKRNQRKKTDFLFKLKERTRKTILRSFKNNNYKKSQKTEDILGCSLQKFKEYIEKQFETWMNWSNHGKYNGELNYGWDLDHIIPLASAKTEEDVIRLNHYTNFQPLCSKNNRDIKMCKFSLS